MTPAEQRFVDFYNKEIMKYNEKHPDAPRALIAQPKPVKQVVSASIRAAQRRVMDSSAAKGRFPLSKDTKIMLSKVKKKN